MAKKSAKRKYRISVCAGSSCSDKGSKKVRAKLKKLVKKRELDDRVKVKKCSCLGDCGEGPVVTIEPGGNRVKRVTPKRAKKLLEKVASGKLGGEKSEEE